MTQRRFVLHREINVTVCKGQVQDIDTKDSVVTAKHVYTIAFEMHCAEVIVQKGLLAQRS